MSFMYQIWQKPEQGFNPCVLALITSNAIYSVDRTGTVHPLKALTKHSSVIVTHHNRAPIMKAEKYIITTEGVDVPVTITRMGYGIAGEEVQKFLSEGAPRVRIRVVGPEKETIIIQDRVWRLLDIKQRIKNLTSDDY